MNDKHIVQNYDWGGVQFLWKKKKRFFAINVVLKKTHQSFGLIKEGINLATNDGRAVC
jgi:hypothetical protein